MLCFLVPFLFGCAAYAACGLHCCLSCFQESLASSPVSVFVVPENDVGNVVAFGTSSTCLSARMVGAIVFFVCRLLV